MGYVAGRRPVREALLGRRQVSRIYLAQNTAPSKLVDEIVDDAGARSIPVNKVEKQHLDKLVGGVTHQGIVAEVSGYPHIGLSEMIDSVREKDKSLVVALDGVLDPQNLGAIIRTAVGVGADGLVIPKRRGASITATVAKTSAGAVEHANVAATNISVAIDRLKEVGFWVVGADAESPTPIWDLDLKGKTMLVLGGENEGLSRLVKSKCDFLASLPMSGKIESLNVSATSAVMIYEIVKQQT